MSSTTALSQNVRSFMVLTLLERNTGHRSATTRQMAGTCPCFIRAISN
jgi:hypothetical protein